MEILQLKSGVNWCKHTLYQLIPLNPDLHPDEKVYKLITDYHYDVIRDENTKLPIGVSLGYGPNLYSGDFIEQLQMKLKEICYAYNKETGEEEDFITLVFEYDISSNNSAATV